jgi:hypothetical protein
MSNELFTRHKKQTIETFGDVYTAWGCIYFHPLVIQKDFHYFKIRPTEALSNGR